MQGWFLVSLPAGDGDVSGLVNSVTVDKENGRGLRWGGHKGSGWVTNYTDFELG